MIDAQPAELPFCTLARTRDLGASLAIERANLNDWLILILPKPTALVKEQAMQIVDAQIHLWSTGLPSNPTHWPLTHFTAEEAVVLMDEGGIDAAVIHPPDWDPGSMELALRAVRGHPGRFVIMASLPLDHSGSRARIAGWRKHPGMLGLRYSFLADPVRQWLADGAIDWLWADSERANVPIYMIATDYDLPRSRASPGGIQGYG